MNESVGAKSNNLLQYDSIEKLDIFSSTCFDICSKNFSVVSKCDFQQCGIFTSVDSDEPVPPFFTSRNSK